MNRDTCVPSGERLADDRLNEESVGIRIFKFNNDDFRSNVCLFVIVKIEYYSN